MLDKAILLARARPLIRPRGSSSISRMVAILSDGVSEFVGENSYQTHPLAKRFSRNPERVHLHAELDAVIKAARYFTGRLGVKRDTYVDLGEFKLSVARVLADGTPALAKPCPDCDRALKYFNVTEVEYTST